MSAPSFYAIIPANVRYCKELEPNAKLLYGEITALAQKEGFCWATNKYFSELYEVDVSTVKRWLSSLEEQQFIKIETEKTGINWQRKIWIFNENQKVFTKAQNCAPPSSKMSPPQLKNEPHINTSNTTSKNPPPPSSPKTEDSKPPTKEEEEELERIFKERDPKAPKIKSRKAWNAVVLNQIREEHAKVVSDMENSKKGKEMALKHFHQALEYADKVYKGFIVLPLVETVFFKKDNGGFHVAYAISDEEWTCQTGWKI